MVRLKESVQRAHSWFDEQFDADYECSSYVHGRHLKYELLHVSTRACCGLQCKCCNVREKLQDDLKTTLCGMWDMRQCEGWRVGATLARQISSDKSHTCRVTQSQSAT
jgi:hypothetical protein